ncbi:hypothetical protein BD309DRAFT_976553 [Dichomitus squalens]|uniref:Uncharacterized protein n=1 Tax=Dichomitus squalens TaxID=114155 RepID=A0A4Q9PAE0_9APHY|nr:uncharacterized protein DICSQDRAFT_135427 [Dichomitus squalens LYAD-421 SS1]EJF62462.1 hypothetical protein DICSQDRAFT_135427 [Dichomitus squalens LYAD-421 SS1]TBU50137.1 hypothetical protein BD309DRAFT_976553 [Dichomitus squalens]TBU66157.1 hypothetical protein BD310DRAFT_972142 [Dichomitus squalens]
MPRRQPPSALRLHVGPLPPRGKPKHTMPSLPRPAFHGPAPTVTTAAGPVPRARMTHTDLPALAIPSPATGGFSAPTATAATAMSTAFEGNTWSGPSSPTSAESTASRKRSREFIRGPWDHSGAIRVPFDVGAVLPPPMPAAINVRGAEEGAAKRPWAV